MPLVCVVMELHGGKKRLHLTSLQKSDKSTQHILNALKHQTEETCEKRKWEGVWHGHKCRKTSTSSVSVQTDIITPNEESFCHTLETEGNKWFSEPLLANCHFLFSHCVRSIFLSRSFKLPLHLSLCPTATSVFLCASPDTCYMVSMTQQHNLFLPLISLHPSSVLHFSSTSNFIILFFSFN